jgi:hypothetical protein
VTVDEFLAGLDHPRTDDIRVVRAAIVSAEPAAVESVKWNAPNYAMGGQDRVTFRVQPRGRFQVVLHRGAAVKDARGFAFDDPEHLVTWASADRGVIDVPAGVASSAGELAKLLAVISRWLRV